MRHIEDTHQENLVKWAKMKTLPIAEYIEAGAKVGDYLYSIPNGGKRGKSEAIRFKRQGLKAGVSDLHLALPMNGYHGLWIELKRPIVKGEKKPDVSKSQKAWLARMNLAGFKAVVCFGWAEAKDIVENYLNKESSND